MNWARILLTPLGLVLLAWGLVVPMLGLFGAEATATVTATRRLNYERNEPLRNRFNYTINYEFAVPDGRTFEGTTMMLGDFSKVPALLKAQPFRVRYAPFWPVISAPAIQARPNIEHPIVAGVGWLLAFGLWRRKPLRRSNAKRGGKGTGPAN